MNKPLHRFDLLLKLRHYLTLTLILALTTACTATVSSQPVGLTGMQQQESADFERAVPGRNFQFPGDHGPHYEFQTEWWYFTGNLEATDGSRFGFQLTFFRRGLQSPEDWIARESNWASDQVYMAHFTITDVEKGKFHYYERIERGAAGLAGAQGEPVFRAWLLDWSAEQTGTNVFYLQAEDGDASLQLELSDKRGAILQGIGGYSQKGVDEGNASYYYSMPRLSASGTLVVDGQSYQVEGSAWMDHEFSTSVLEDDQVGWDWFALQLDDNSELMVFILRNDDGSLSPFSQGQLILPDGATRSLAREDFFISVTQRWKSPHTGADYPAGWVIEVPGEELRLEVKPLLLDQELRVSFTYWEGAVEVQGVRQGDAVSGRGYVELTGYAHSMQGRL